MSKAPFGFAFYTLCAFCFAVAVAFSQLLLSCGASTPPIQVADPVGLCAVALSQAPAIATEAGKIGMTPVDLARRICADVVLGANIVQKHLDGTSVTPNQTDAGTAGAGP